VKEAEPLRPHATFGSSLADSLRFLFLGLDENETSEDAEFVESSRLFDGGIMVVAARG